jgi:hypothetical protein
MTPADGVLLLIIGLVATVGFFGILYWAMDDRPQTKPKEEDNAVTKFWKKYNSN